jgi:hypothetical protein
VLEKANGLAGVSVALSVLWLYATVPGTVFPEASRSRNVAAEIVAGSISSLNVAVTAIPGLTLTPTAPAAGDTVLTTGAAASGNPDVAKTTSTQ